MLLPLRSMAAGLLLVASLAACSANAAAPSGVASLESPGASAEASAAPSASLDPETAQLEFAKCMRDHGIDMPDPETAPGGGFTQRVEIGKDDAEKMQAAQEACDHFLDQAGGPRREMDPAQLDKLVEFAQCMREHGVDMPDPTADGKGGIFFRTTSPAMASIPSPRSSRRRRKRADRSSARTAALGSRAGLPRSPARTRRSRESSINPGWPGDRPAPLGRGGRHSSRGRGCRCRRARAALANAGGP
jgi:hypothetical protein